MGLAVYELRDDIAIVRDIPTGPYFAKGLESLIPQYEPTPIRPLDIGAFLFQQVSAPISERIIAGLLLSYCLVESEDRAIVADVLCEVNMRLRDGPWFNSQYTINQLLNVLSYEGTYIIMGPERRILPIRSVDEAPRAVDIPRGIPYAA